LPFLPAAYLKAQLEKEVLDGESLLTFNCVIRVNRSEVARDRNVGEDERSLHNTERAINFRKAFLRGPGAKMTWALSCLLYTILRNTGR